jgi:hypothetical protein
MKLMECECGRQYYSIDAKPVECVYCYRKVTKLAPAGSFDPAGDMDEKEVVEAYNLYKEN